jgi:hypothetical protein
MTETATLLTRMVGAARLDPRVFEEVEHDPEATNQAFMIVVLAGVAGGLANVREDGAAVAAGIAANLAGWSLFALLAWLIGTVLFGTAETKASWYELARALGFAYTPRLLAAFGFIPTVGPFIAAAGLLWFAVAAVVAMRQALDFTTVRALGTGAVCLGAQALLGLAIYALLGASPAME